MRLVAVALSTVAHKARACEAFSVFLAVSRIKARSEVYEMDLLLDVNVDVYPLDVRHLFRPRMRCLDSFSSLAASCHDRWPLDGSSTINHFN